MSKTPPTKPDADADDAYDERGPPLPTSRRLPRGGPLLPTSEVRLLAPTPTPSLRRARSVSSRFARRSRPPPSPPPARPVASARPRATRPPVPTSAVASSRPRAAGSRALTAVASAAKPSSVLLPNGRGWGSGGGLFSVDFVGLCCKYKRARRWLGVSRSRALPRLLSTGKPTPPSSVKAVLHLERAGYSSSPRGEPPRQSGDKLQGNLNRMQSCENSLKSPVWHGRENEIRPFGNPKASDSANLDSAAELLIRSGQAPEESLMILVPEVYKNHPTLSIKYPEVVDFYEYYKGQMEAWDGPALLLFRSSSNTIRNHYVCFY
ncbi:ferredoxin-dependent glutamate synthase-like [Syzygium oleosum]|uniref:ferredoxin-dependent glutamate synthase-like n=1 Tax=Syzygium oleosum TaxID=219896 RepID=UPI0024BAF437|nr:ferredoxin-dependent glutamate synthase-like [Syzygium oleosum]